MFTMTNTKKFEICNFSVGHSQGTANFCILADRGGFISMHAVTTV